MPWTASQAKEKTAKCDTPHKQEVWAKVANETLERETKKGTKEADAEAIAIKSANAAVANIKEEVVSGEQQGRFRERAQPQASPLTVDETNGVIKDVLVLGGGTRGMGIYAPAVMQEAAQLYDGMPTFVNHTKDGSNPPYDNKLGVHHNPHMSPEGIRTDFHFNPQHRCASQLIWDAKNDPKNVGFSHDADCAYEIRDGRRHVTKIRKVYSIDLVGRPGTTRGLWEEEEPGEFIEGEIKKESPALSVPAGSTFLKEEEVFMVVEYKDITLETLSKERPDLVAKLQGTDDMSRLTEEAKMLKADNAAKDKELDGLKAEKAMRLREVDVAAEVQAAKFPTNDELLYSKRFQEQLIKAEKPERAELIRERMALAARLRETAIPAPLTNFQAPPTDTADTSKEKRFFGE
jgi:hypothetical protein